MKYTITLRDNSTGETKDYQEKYDWEEEHSMLYQWFDGNYSCDCNRAIFMKGEYIENAPCSDGKIDVIKIVDEAGNEIDFSSYL